MSYTRMIAMMTGVSIGTYSLLHVRQAEKVTMRSIPTTDHHATLQNFDYLVNSLQNQRSSSHLFMASLRRQSLTAEQVTTLATLAIKHAQVVELNALAKAYPAALTKEWLQAAIIKEGNRFTYSALVRKNAKNRLPYRSYLFDTQNDLIILEEQDKASYHKARLYAQTHPAQIVTVDTEYYDPTFKMHT